MVIAALWGRLWVHTAHHHRPRPDRSDPARGPADAPVPFNQRPLLGAPGAGICQGNGLHGRFAPAPGGGNLDPVRRDWATLTRRLLDAQTVFPLTFRTFSRYTRS